MTSGRKVAKAIISFVNAQSLRLEFAKVKAEACLCLFLCMGLWERSRIRTVQMDKLRGFTEYKEKSQNNEFSDERIVEQ